MPNKIRVGFITPSLAMGGAERWMISLAKHCDPKKIEWVGTVVTSHGPVAAALAAQMVKHMPIYGTEVVGDPENVTICNSQADAMQRLKERADVLVTWGIGDVGAYTGPLDCPLIFVSHGSGKWSFDALQSSKSQCSHFAAVSKAAAAALPEGMPVIENGIETERCVPKVTREEFRHKWGIPQDATVVAYVGRYSDEKNPIAVAQAVKQIDNDNVIALYCGEGWKEEELKSEVEDMLREKAIFIPFQDQIGDVFNAIDVFVLASETEGFSLALTEAWYVGTPTVATRVGAVPDLEERFGGMVTAIPVNPNPEELADAVELALWNACWTSEREQRRIVVEENFTAEIMGKKWTDYIEQVANEKPNPKVKEKKNLAVITSLFGLSGNDQRIKNFHEFRRNLGSVPFYAIEASFDGQFIVPDALHVNCCPEKQSLWQKERMLNLLADQLPPEIESIAWVDSDILFQNPDWYQQTTRALEVNPVVQMWSYAHFSNKDGTIERTFQSSGSVGGYSTINPRPHCGYAWAMRRETWDEISGLFDMDIVGGGDAWMAHAFFGERSGEFLRNASRAMLEEFAKYHEKCWDVIQSRVGHVPGDIVHLYHGNFKDRRYWEKHRLLKEYRYNPNTDLMTGANGLYEWAGQNTGLQTRIAYLF